MNYFADVYVRAKIQRVEGKVFPLPFSPLHLDKRKNLSFSFLSYPCILIYLPRSFEHVYMFFFRTLFKFDLLRFLDFVEDIIFADVS